MPAGSEPTEKKPLKQDPTQDVVNSFKKNTPAGTSHRSGHRSGHRS